MTLAQPFNKDAVTAEVNRFMRLYPREMLGEVIAEYIAEHFVPRLAPKKEQTLLVPYQQVVRAIERFFDLPMEAIAVKSRNRKLVYARHMMLYFLSTRTELSLNEAGKMFNQDHTTVMSARNKIIRAYQRNPTVRSDVDFLINLLFPEKELTVNNA